MALFIEALVHILHAQIAVCTVWLLWWWWYIAQTLYLHSGGYPWQLALVVLFLVALAHILHAKIATCSVMVCMLVVIWCHGSGAMGWMHVVVVYNIIIFGLRVKRILYIKFDCSLLPMNKYSNIRSTGSDCQIWPSSVERLLEMGGESQMKSKTGEFDLTESIFLQSLRNP